MRIRRPSPIRRVRILGRPQAMTGNSRLRMNNLPNSWDLNRVEEDDSDWIYENMADEDVMPEMSREERDEIQNNIMQNLRKKADEALRINEERLASRVLTKEQQERCNSFNDQNVCRYGPLDMEDWCEHPQERYYGPDEKKRCFDLEELLQHFEAALTTMKNGNLYPNYPHDPFDRSKFSLEELAEIADAAESASVDIDTLAPHFVQFMEWCTSLSEEDLEKVDGNDFSYEIMDKVIDLFRRGSQ